MTHSDLISKLEALTGPSREVDGEIALAVEWTFQKLGREGGRGDSRPYWRRPGCTEWYERSQEGPPRYTESIDAALTLVPESDAGGRKLWIRLNQFAGSHGSGKECWHAELFGIENEQAIKYWGMHPIAAIALCIACLKAREKE